MIDKTLSWQDNGHQCSLYFLYLLSNHNSHFQKGKPHAVSSLPLLHSVQLLGMVPYFIIRRSRSPKLLLHSEPWMSSCIDFLTLHPDFWSHGFWPHNFFFFQFGPSFISCFRNTLIALWEGLVSKMLWIPTVHGYIVAPYRGSRSFSANLFYTTSIKFS